MRSFASEELEGYVLRDKKYYLHISIHLRNFIPAEII